MEATAVPSSSAPARQPLPGASTAPAAYLDWAAGAPLGQAARESMCAWLAAAGGNPSSLHARGRVARAHLEEARSAVATLLGGKPSELVLTSGGTEAANLGLLGAARARRALDGRNHLVVSAIEHAAIAAAADWLEREGFEVTRISPQPTGRVDPAEVQQALRPTTSVVALMAVNNETGVLQPMSEVCEVAHQRQAWVLCDAVQAVGYGEPVLPRWDVDLLTCSSHKLGGPPGAGALWCRPGLELAPLLLGGGQENQRRGGTEALPTLIGFGAAARHAHQHRVGRAAAVARLRALVDEGLRAAVPDAICVGAEVERADHIRMILLPGTEAETLLCALDLCGVMASSGAACSSHTMETSHVLLAMGFDELSARSALRLSWGPETEEQEVALLVSRLPGVVERNRRATAAARRSLERSRAVRARGGVA